MNLISLPNIHIEQEYHTLEERKLFLEQEAQRMRENPTEGEKLFKDFCDKYDIPYTNQKPVMVGYKGFIIDFEIISTGNPEWHSSKKRKIAVEIDGEYHNTKEQKKKDSARTKTLKGGAFVVFRLSNEDVKNENTIIDKFLLFLSSIKETVLKNKLQQIKEDNIETVKDTEVAYWKSKYYDLKAEYDKLKGWSDRVNSFMYNNLLKKTM